MLTAPFAKQALNWGEQRLVWRDLFAEVSRGSVVVAADELSLFVGYVSDFWGGTDIAKISRKRSKPDNHGHGNGKECTKAERMLLMVNKSTDISKITRKPSKTGKHGHEKRKSTREAKDSKPKPKKVNSQSTMGQQSQLTRRQKSQ
ncbi:hypothetical protein Tco_0620170 [Tanacetum coccineum]